MNEATKRDLESRITAIHADIEGIRNEMGLSAFCINAQDYSKQPLVTGHKDGRCMIAYYEENDAFKELEKHDPIAKAKQELKEIEERREKLLKITEGGEHD